MLDEFLKAHGEYFDNKTFKELTTIKMGGGIKHFVKPNSIEDLKDIIVYLRENKVDYKIIGNGSNLICGSSFYEGVVISLAKLNNFEINNTSIYVEAGVLVPYLANTLGKQGLSGLEFAGGIPGNIGGLIYMNAGAYKCAIGDLIEKVLVIRSGEFVWMNKDELNFSYRYSIFQEHPHWTIVAAYLNLSKGNSEEIFALMNDRLTRRKNTQPLDMPSAGSCFRNPENDFAWKLIDSINYRGYKKNGVMVSEKHSNFIVNVNEGTAEDYLAIAYEIIDKVKNKYNIKLVMEVEKFNC